MALLAVDSTGPRPVRCADHPALVGHREELDQPAPAGGGLEGHRGARRKHAKDRDQLGRVVGQVAVALLDAGAVHDGDLGALAMHAHADTHIHQGLLLRARIGPEA
jgi:hypothetical protein